MADTEDKGRAGGPALAMALGERGLLYKVILYWGSG